MEEFLKNILYEYKNWAYLIIFLWCIAEGELALILGGIFAHEGHVNLGLIIFVAGLGGFVGDQIYFYIGRYNKKYIQRKLVKQRRKFAVAHLLLQKFGWPIIFIQRYMYGFRTIIPMSIGITRYSAKKFAFINLISAWAWAAITILLAWHFGQLIWAGIDWAESHWYFAVPIIGGFLATLFFGIKYMEKRILNERKNRRNVC
ncbi:MULTISPECIES: DedA family protein [Campylobacter]|uniref:DedA family protein n=1 Tax=Campylobacter vicugnae TaxID=1660076 RepID=A0ABZ2E5L6_9BACT|nr:MULTISPECIES: DedA family protein [Campylobacter]MCR8690032.1 DedA family protein [Campylobacter sp. RM9264]MCR8700370.1 DedA family protein [Campylobacter sp. RM12176]ARR04056.1 putative membrane protein, DedA family, type I (SNARE domain) [Campylobacter sp. RM12175]MBE6429782.1 DedA family protein [Campylobacter sp.]MBO5063927.1 DedA family protein [Campylobacter sp.]